MSKLAQTPLDQLIEELNTRVDAHTQEYGLAGLKAASLSRANSNELTVTLYEEDRPEFERRVKALVQAAVAPVNAVADELSTKYGEDFTLPEEADGLPAGRLSIPVSLDIAECDRWSNAAFYALAVTQSECQRQQHVVLTVESAIFHEGDDDDSPAPGWTIQLLSKRIVGAALNQRGGKYNQPAFALEFANAGKRQPGGGGGGSLQDLLEALGR